MGRSLFSDHFVPRTHSTTPWTKDDHDFLANVIKQHGPTLGDLTRLVVRGLSKEQQDGFFKDISKLIEKYPLEPQALVLDIRVTQDVMTYYVNELLALPY